MYLHFQFNYKKIEYRFFYIFVNNGMISVVEVVHDMHSIYW